MHSFGKLLLHFHAFSLAGNANGGDYVSELVLICLKAVTSSEYLPLQGASLQFDNLAFSSEFLCGATVVLVALRISLARLLVIHDPVLVVDDILVEVFVADLERELNEPLVGDRVELHLVADLPIVHAAAELNLVVTRAPVVQQEELWPLVVGSCAVKRRDDGVQLSWALFQFGKHLLVVFDVFVHCLGSTLVNVTEQLAALLLSKDLLNDADRCVVVELPVGKELDHLVNTLLVDKVLVRKAAELGEPSFADNLTLHGVSESVLTQLGVLVLDLENGDGAFNRCHEILVAIVIETEAGAFFRVPLELDNRIFQTAGLKRDDRCLSDEEFMLHNSSGLKSRRHQSEVRASVDQRSIGEEFVRCSPEAVRVLVLEVPHLACTSTGVGILHVGWASNQEHDFEVGLHNEVFGDINN